MPTPGLPGHRRGDGGAAEGGQKPGEWRRTKTVAESDAVAREEKKRILGVSSQLILNMSSCTAPGHHNAVREDPDGGDAKDLQTSPPRVWFPR